MKTTASISGNPRASTRLASKARAQKEKESDLFASSALQAAETHAGDGPYRVNTQPATDESEGRPVVIYGPREGLLNLPLDILMEVST